ncbi:MAG: sigma-70 family RNA polymerase sigma factor [Candidatus Omnitrophota bacterium]|jgi:RNA polymerase sigma factor (sigma-70 family)
MTFEELVKKISSVLKRIAYRLNGQYASFDHDDLYQVALVHLWDHFQSGKLRNKTDSYILQGCYFHLKNYIRKARVKYMAVSLETMLYNEDEGVRFEEILSEAHSLIYSDRDRLHDKLLVETIMNNGFSPLEKEMFGYFADGLTIREIGGKLGISHVMVIKRMAKIKEKCRKYIDPI